MPEPVPLSKAQSSNSAVHRIKKKPGPSLKQGMPRIGKSRLVTLRASAEEEDEKDDYDMTEDEGTYLSNAEEEENQAFVPIGLRSEPSFRPEVEESMEEVRERKTYVHVFERSAVTVQ